MKKTDPCRDAVALLKSKFPASQHVLSVPRSDFGGSYIEADGYDVSDMQSIVDALSVHSGILVLYRTVVFDEKSFFIDVYARAGDIWLVFYCNRGSTGGATPKSTSELVKAIAKMKNEAEDLDDEDEDFDDEPNPLDAVTDEQMAEYIDVCSKAKAMRFAKNFRDRQSVCIKVLAGLGLDSEMVNLVSGQIASYAGDKCVNEVLPVIAKELLSEGKTNKEIAAELGVTATKVKFLIS